MIRIIDETPHKSVVKEAICGNCGVTIEYTPNEVKSSTHHDYGGGNDTYYHVVCPKCNHQINVKR